MRPADPCYSEEMPAAHAKPSNPKDAFGVLKYSMSYVPAPVLGEIALGMHEGGFKYGGHNYRVIGVKCSVYYDATMRHLMAWWEGEDIDNASGAQLHHIAKAITSLVVLRDAIMQGNVDDDRPPRAKPGWVEALNTEVVKLASKTTSPVPRYTERALR